MGLLSLTITILNYFNNSNFRIYFLFALFFILPCFPTWLSSKVQDREYGYIEKFSSQEETLLAKIFFRDKINKIDSLMKYSHRHYRFHGNVLAAYKGHLIYHNAFGTAEFKNDQPLTNQTAFELASVSKQFTAVAIMMLVERGWLHYNDPVKNYLPQLPYKGIKIRHLLNHTAGLPNYMWLLEHHWQGESIPYNDETIDLMAEHKLNLYFKPGHYFHYSNTGYILLASVIEKVSGMRYGEFLEKNIFSPLGMENTFVNSAADPENIHYPKAVQGYRWTRWGFRRIEETVNDGTVGDKGIYSTTLDLFKWTRALHNNKLLSQSTLDKAFNHDEKENYYRSSYGYGFRIRDRKDQEIVYHNGIWSGFRTSLKHFLPEGNTLILLNHTDSRAKRVIVRRMERILNESSQNEIAFEMVKKALAGNPDQAMELFNKWFNKENEGIIDLNKIEQSIKILKQNQKLQLAAKLESFSGKVSYKIVTHQFDRLDDKFDKQYPDPTVKVAPR